MRLKSEKSEQNKNEKTTLKPHTQNDKKEADTTQYIPVCVSLWPEEAGTVDKGLAAAKPKILWRLGATGARASGRGRLGGGKNTRTKSDDGTAAAVSDGGSARGDAAVKLEVAREPPAAATAVGIEACRD